MGETAKQKCDDCGGVLADIEIIDKTVPSWPWPTQAMQTTLEYVVPTRERKFLLDALPIEGQDRGPHVRELWANRAVRSVQGGGQVKLLSSAHRPHLQQVQLVPHRSLELVQQRLRRQFVARMGREPLVVDVALTQVAQAEPVLAPVVTT
jgi:hypothetical protein